MKLLEVVGGADFGGILVQESAQTPAWRRLTPGARVRELERCGGRVRYSLLTGTGPEEGWVSLKSGSRELLRPLLADEVPAALADGAALAAARPRLGELATHLMSEGWARVERLGVPARVLVEAHWDIREVEPHMAGGITVSYSEDADRWGVRVAILDEAFRSRRPGLARLNSFLLDLVRQAAPALGVELTGQEPTMLSCYDPGGSVVAHVDNRGKGREARILTAIYYLNRKWSPEKGGALRVEAAGAPVDLMPDEDSLVLLRADTAKHEVRKAHARRFAVTIFFNGFWHQFPR